MTRDMMTGGINARTKIDDFNGGRGGRGGKVIDHWLVNDIISRGEESIVPSTATAAAGALMKSLSGVVFMFAIS